MGVPATTGQLRTKISEMEIGDYIGAGYYAPTTGSIDPTPIYPQWIGNVEGFTELPITGMASSNLGSFSFYFVKVAKGLLVADRVCQHSIAWDKLNTNKYIQGKPFDTGNIIPTMTSNTSPSGVASASSELTSRPSWKAFNNTNSGWSDAWATQFTGDDWIQYEFTEPKMVTNYSLDPYENGGFSHNPKDWKFQASADGQTWITIDEQVGFTNWGLRNQPKYFSAVNKEAYKFYRILITANNGGADVGIGELRLFDTVGTIRSLTGGVTYADANGNKSLTDKGFGLAFPGNSEFDKYILEFDKIQAEKTLDDVFHHQAVKTWTQDTPVLAIAAATQRVSRGGTGTANFSHLTSSTANTTVGFRPAFSYKE